MALRKIDSIEDAWTLWQEDLLRDEDGHHWVTRKYRPEVASLQDERFALEFKYGAYVEVEE